jgi:hypothetical protein
MWCATETDVSRTSKAVRFVQYTEKDNNQIKRADATKFNGVSSVNHLDKEKVDSI